MGYYEAYDLLGPKGGVLVSVRAVPCFANLFGYGVSNIMGKDLTLKIYQYKDYDFTGANGVKNWFSPEDRLLYLDLIEQTTGVRFEQTEMDLDLDTGWTDKSPSGIIKVPTHVLTLKTNTVATYIQLKAAVIATRYLIESPFAGMLKVALDKYKDGVHEDFFQLLQDAHYKEVSHYMNDHTWIPGLGMFWGLIKSAVYKEWLITPKTINSFGEVLKQHHTLFQELHTSGMTTLNLEPGSELSRIEYLNKKLIPFEQLIVI